MTSNQPPTFAPKNSKSRPSAGKAKVVGGDKTGDKKTSAPTRRSVMSKRSDATPPSYSPRSRSASSAGSEEAVAYSRRPRQPRTYSPASSASRTVGGANFSSETSPVHDVRTSPSVTDSAKSSFSAGKALTGIISVILIAIISWFAYIFMYGNSKLEHVEALSGRADTPGETYLIVGSDKRESGAVDDGTDGQRADTIMVLQLPDTGHAALISLPRDTLVEIPGYGMSKINAAYAYGGPALLVQTVENLTGLTVDHYVEVSMGGVQNLVNAVDGVNLCYDEDVSDAYSGMEWTAGCHDVNGDQALAFSRMRYSDPLGDIGRTMRQRQVVSKVIDKAASSSTLAHPMRQRAIVGAAADNLTTDTGTSLFGLAQAGLGLRFAMGEGGLMGTPPISNMGYWYGGQSCVQLNPDTIDEFWRKFTYGELTSEDLTQTPGS